MVITEEQRGTLVRVINAAFEAAAEQMSELTACHVSLEIPQVTIRPIDNLVAAFQSLLVSGVAAVHQELIGRLPLPGATAPFTGEALLLMSEEAGRALSETMTGSAPDLAGRSRVSSAHREVLNEIGNILLNACMASLTRILQVEVRLGAPHVYVEGLERILERLLQKRLEARFGLVIATRFRLEESEITGWVVILMSVASFDILLAAVDQHS